MRLRWETTDKFAIAFQYTVKTYLLFIIHCNSVACMPIAVNCRAVIIEYHAGTCSSESMITYKATIGRYNTSSRCVPIRISIKNVPQLNNIRVSGGK